MNAFRWTMGFCLFFMVLAVSWAPAAAESPLLEQGMAQYKQENYEEAVEILEKARQQDPKSSTAAFFLGLTYKQIFAYDKAADNLRDAVSLEPKIRDALVELIEVLYRAKTKESLAEAKSWIAIAEEQEIHPAKVAFLEGLEG